MDGVDVSPMRRQHALGVLWLAAAAVCAPQVLHYAEATETQKLRNFDSGFLVDILQQPYKSYMEFARALLRVISEPAVYRKLKQGYLLPFPGDWFVSILPNPVLAWVALFCNRHAT